MKLFIVNHPGIEPGYRGRRRCPKTGMTIVPWNNTKKHRRKYIERKGIAITTSGVMLPKGLLQFWAEYEPKSYCVLASKGIAVPKAVHKRLVPVGVRGNPFVRRKGIYCINTDPYVFGSPFYYTCCMRYLNKGSYNSGDIILFGSLRMSTPATAQSPSLFNTLDIDTVFVVEREVSVLSIPQNTNFYKASILPLGKPISSVVEARMFTSFSTPFSFVPCSASSSTFGKKPSIDLTTLGFNPIRSRRRLAPISTSSATVWPLIMASMNGFNLGIEIDSI